MPRDDLLYLDDMLEMAEKVNGFVETSSREEFDADRKFQLATVHLLQIIGEAAWKVSSPFKLANPQIPWKEIAGFRHRAVHNYFDIRLDIVWDIATREMNAHSSAEGNHSARRASRRSLLIH